ncbi:PREDICTED: uncharacterized protein LOC105150458 isoform X1 [Acromyrmex echinatior]|uniref:uncharacterized protein LOC105150458 isoform X1 n=1 Tax=Acromyrmex echinatior TaxID=103372 RepID=UPI000580B86D|nr:PREDICTED: uncharacterized protein LOC105150458 isoform X1 [Acromyrmex echinatior]
MASLKYVVFSLLIMMLVHHYAESMTVLRIDKQAIERHTFNKRSVQRGYEKGASNGNGGIDQEDEEDYEEDHERGYLEELASLTSFSKLKEKTKQFFNKLINTIINATNKEVYANGKIWNTIRLDKRK